MRICGIDHEFQNVIATYLGVILYIVLYIAYAIYEWIWVKPPHHFVPIDQADLDTDAVWERGEGDLVRQRDRELDEKVASAAGEAHGAKRWMLRFRRVTKHVY